MIRIAFFNNKGGVGKTTLVFHVAHMLAELGRRVLLLDLDPQSNLTAMCVGAERLEELWPSVREHPRTILGAVRPFLRGTGDVIVPEVEAVGEGVGMIPGDLGLSTFEDHLADAWPRAIDRREDAFRVLSAFHRVAAGAAESFSADTLLIDVAPSLGALNRAALLDADSVITPLAPDLYSIQGLRHLGPSLVSWRESWAERRERSPDPTLALPRGAMQPLGYVVMQAGMRLDRPVLAYQRWVARIPNEYREAMGIADAPPREVSEDPWCLGLMRHFQSLMPLAQDARKPMFRLRPGDGAIGAHMDAVRRCREDFERLARRIVARVAERAVAVG